MALVNIANAGPTSIRVASVPVPGHDPDMVFTIVGNRAPSAIANLGLTFDVDAATFAQWSTAHPEQARSLKIVSDAEIAELTALVSDPQKTHGYEIGLQYIADNPPPTEAPVVVDTPAVAQFGGVLRCTEGNWENVPTSKSFVWQMDGVAVGVGAPAYAVQPSDVGHSFDCIVTAHNAIGSTEAPPSNSVIAT